MNELFIQLLWYPPPAGYQSIPALAKTSEAYKQWHAHLQHIPKLARYSIGMKIDTLFTDLIELLIRASYAEKGQKLNLVNHAIIELNTLKYFLQLMWEMKLLDHRTFGSLSRPLHETGKMMTGWKKYLET